MRIFSLAAVLGLFLAACSSMENVRSFDSFETKDTSVYFVGEHAPSAPAFNLAVRTALGGNDRELAYLLTLAQYTDAATAPAYGQYLHDLRKFVGAFRFDQTLRRIAQVQQEKVKVVMESAAKSKITR